MGYTNSVGACEVSDIVRFDVTVFPKKRGDTSLAIQTSFWFWRHQRNSVRQISIKYAPLRALFIFICPKAYLKETETLFKTSSAPSMSIGRLGIS